MIKSGNTKGMKYCGDCLCDDAIDGLWDIDHGRIVHEENSEILRVILIRCHHMIEEDEENSILSHGNNNNNNSYNNNNQKFSYNDTRIKEFLTHLYSTPTWLDLSLLKNGASLLLSRISWLFTTYLDFTIPEIISSSEGLSLYASIANSLAITSKESQTQSSPNNDKSNNNEKNENNNNFAGISISDNDVEFLIKRIFNLIFRSFVAASSKCLKPSTDIWDDLLELRIEIGLLRRKILSIFGIGRWDEKKFGMPLNQQFLGYCLGLFALHSINLIKSQQFGSITENDVNSILHIW